MSLQSLRLRLQPSSFALALIFAWLVAAWLAMPWLLSRLLPQLPAVAGWSVQAAEFSEIGLGRTGLTRLKLHYTGPNGERLGLDLADLRADYSLLDRHLDRLQIDQAKLSWQAGRPRADQPWPRLHWSALPWSEIRIDRLLAAIELDSARRWDLDASVGVRQNPDGRIELQARWADERFQIDFRPGEPASAAVTWHSSDRLDLADPAVNFYVTYAKNKINHSKTPSKNTTENPIVQIRGELSATVINRLTARFQPQNGNRVEQGRLKLDTEIRLGPTFGQWEAITTRIKAQTLKLLIHQAPTPIAIDLDGSLQWQARSAEPRPIWRVELLPELEFHAKPLKRQAWAVQARLEKPLSLASNSQTVTGNLPLRLQLDGWNPLPIKLDQLTLAVGADLTPSRVTGRLRLPATSLRSGWPATSIDARWRWQDRQLSGRGHVNLGAQELLSFDARHAIIDACTTAEFRHHDDLVRLGRLVPRPRALLPLRLQGGRSEGWLSLRFCKDADAKDGKSEPLIVNGGLTLHQAVLGWERAQASGLDINVTIKSLDPVAGQLEFELGRLSLAAGIELSAVRLGLGWSGRHLLLRRFDAGLFDGHLSVLDQGLELPPAPGRLALDAEGIDLARLLAAINLKGLSGSGRLSGRLPLAWSEAGAEIRGGRLTSTGPGLLRYQPPTQLADNPGLQALRNFHYSRLDLEIDYAASGSYRLRLKLDGHNPDLYGGHPIAFKLDLNGSLPGLFRGALLSGNFDAYLLEQLQRGKLE